MKLNLLTLPILLSSACLSWSVFAEGVSNRTVFGVHYDIHSSKTSESNGGKYDRGWASMVNLTNAGWGDFAAILHLDDYTISGDGNNDHTKGCEPYSTIRTIFDVNYNLSGEDGKGLNIWVQNFTVANRVIVENEIFAGFSYDLEAGDVSVRPRVGVSYFNLLAFTPYEQVNGYQKKAEFSGFNGYTLGVDVRKVFMVGIPLITEIKATYMGGWNDEYVEEAFAVDDYSYNVEIGLKAAITRNFNLGVAATTRHNFAGYGKDGEFITLSAGYVF
ncbi:hypothetical protein [Shewanella sp. NIFS-20-20]|uniref:hypothetical protein n=1 Tax=Shewanella sp. NIFS-20-20 TaxID=2853806 RepID=UPI001C4706B6|nr:hypothetical protein [Shewanella sp. NIFS-20-20]MBV7317578.1 hypothetical protein [Shewanella sp. NIFS-20-20]